ncbi:MAG: endonuclease/exonuclease/phosphatase family protein [Candidatus Sumerlaeia bacterium]|nr:endonuclease/exonuclease/phosphatase family protein [Candidatus Sumerlaeia bacterium]
MRTLPSLLLLLLLLAGGCARRPETIRIAVFNIRELSTDVLTATDKRGRGVEPQAVAAARVIQRVRPDILVINEIDHDYSTPQAAQDLALNLRRFQEHYLAHGPDPIRYDHAFAAPCNTGIPSGADLGRDGKVSTAEDAGSRGYADDCFGYGEYPGQYSMGVLSRLPVDAERARSWRRLLWRDMPGNNLPPGHFDESQLAALRLSSKSHWAVPVLAGGGVIHLVVAHPTPQGFDGPEDRNGRRNWDEARLVADIIGGAGWLVDDLGAPGGLGPEEEFVVLGDMNADPRRGTRIGGRTAIDQILAHPRVQDVSALQSSAGALRERAPGQPELHEFNTFGDRDGSRYDYALPSRGLAVRGAGVHWPSPLDDPDGAITAEFASDHRLVWVDVEAPGAP